MQSDRGVLLLLLTITTIATVVIVITRRHDVIRPVSSPSSPWHQVIQANPAVVGRTFTCD
jgi:hypothetical protein